MDNVAVASATRGSDQRWRLAIVDDHEMFAEALTVWSRDHLADVEVVYAGPDPAAVPAGTDLVLLDIDLGPGTGPVAQVTADLVASGAAVLLVSALAEASRIRPGLVAGALGYVPKRAGAETLFAAIEAALPFAPSWFGFSPIHLERTDLEPVLAAARTALGIAAFDTAWAQGQALTLEQALAEGLAWCQQET